MRSHRAEGRFVLWFWRRGSRHKLWSGMDSAGDKWTSEASLWTDGWQSWECFRGYRAAGSHGQGTVTRRECTRAARCRTTCYTSGKFCCHFLYSIRHHWEQYVEVSPAYCNCLSDAFSCLVRPSLNMKYENRWMHFNSYALLHIQTLLKLKHRQKALYTPFAHISSVTRRELIVAKTVMYKRCGGHFHTLYLQYAFSAVLRFSRQLNNRGSVRTNTDGCSPEYTRTLLESSIVHNN